jgi:hypothetical protein
VIYPGINTPTIDGDDGSGCDECTNNAVTRVTYRGLEVWEGEPPLPLASDSGGWFLAVSEDVPLLWAALDAAEEEALLDAELAPAAAVEEPDALAEPDE